MTHHMTGEKKFAMSLFPTNCKGKGQNSISQPLQY